MGSFVFTLRFLIRPGQVSAFASVNKLLCLPGTRTAFPAAIPEMDSETRCPSPTSCPAELGDVALLPGDTFHAWMGNAFWKGHLPCAEPGAGCRRQSRHLSAHRGESMLSLGVPQSSPTTGTDTRAAVTGMSLPRGCHNRPPTARRPSTHAAQPRTLPGPAVGNSSSAP